MFQEGMPYTPGLEQPSGSQSPPSPSFHAWGRTTRKSGWTASAGAAWICAECGCCLNLLMYAPLSLIPAAAIARRRTRLRFLPGWRSHSLKPCWATVPIIAPSTSRTQLQLTSLRQGDIPIDFLDASAAHLCPVDYLTHSLLPAVLRQAELTTVTLDPSPGYMNPTFWDEVPALVTGLTAFLPSEEEISSLFQGRSSDLWEMASALAAYGCEIIVIKRGERGQLLFDAASGARWEVTAYPSRVVNPTGAGDAFCGGFLAGYRRTYDPLEAVLFGNISASLVVEGTWPTVRSGCTTRIGPGAPGSHPPISPENLITPHSDGRRSCRSHTKPGD